MERLRLLECLADDFARLRAVAAADLTAAVPSCPGWTVTDLVRHVAQVYLHKSESMRHNAFPDPWPPAGIESEDPLTLLDRSYAALTKEFADRDPAEPSPTWHAPDQTVGFWIRRMAQESVIHRLDAELALAVPSAPIPADLATDGVDEVLTLFVDYGSRVWTEDFAPVLSTAAGRTVLVRVEGGPAWLVRTTPTGAETTDVPPTDVLSGGGAGFADATVTGDAVGVLRWLWARETPDAEAGARTVRLDGSGEALTEFRSLLNASTQ